MLIVAGIGVAVFFATRSADAQGLTERSQVAANQQAQIMCPHCQVRGQVTKRFERRAKRKTATRVLGATATLGASLPLAGVSKKGTVQVMSCGNCGMTWDIENARP